MLIRVIGSYFFFLCVITLYYFRYVDWAVCLLVAGLITLYLVHRAMKLAKKLDATRRNKGIH